MHDLWLTPTTLRLPARPDYAVPRVLLLSDGLVVQLPYPTVVDKIELPFIGLAAVEPADPTLFWRFDASLETGKQTKADAKTMLVDSVIARRLRILGDTLEITTASLKDSALLAPIRAVVNRQPTVADVTSALRLAGYASSAGFAYLYQSRADRPSATAFRTRLSSDYVWPAGNHDPSAYVWRETVSVD